VYSPAALIVPAVESPPVRPSTDHVTVLFALFVTVAENCVVAPTVRFTEDWFSDTLTASDEPGVPDEPPMRPHALSDRATARLKQQLEIVFCSALDAVAFIGNPSKSRMAGNLGRELQIAIERRVDGGGREIVAVSNPQRLTVDVRLIRASRRRGDR
jgi:hypothetical protein